MMELADGYRSCAIGADWLGLLWLQGTHINTLLLPAGAAVTQGRC